MVTGVVVDRRYWLAGTLAASALVAGAGPAHARSDTVAYWEMDDRGTTMYDHSGNNLDGHVGREVRTGNGSFRFGVLRPDTPPTHPEHLVTVPDRASLDPRGNDFSITLRLRAHEQFGNIIQKGQATVAGGSYKLQFPSGQPECWFRGARGQVLVRSPEAVNDRRWHVIQCVRTSEGVALSVDGRTVAGRRGPTGTIDNSWPLSIGGKTACDQVHVGCDYFAGDIDYVKIASAPAGAYARSLPASAPAAGHAGSEPADNSDNGDWGDGWDDGWDDWGGHDW